MVLALLALPTSGFAQKTDTVYKYVLDYDVPESPAFAALGVTAANVLRGGAAKPIVVSTVTDVLNSGKLKGGLALDISPMVFANPTFTSFDDYRKSLAGKLLRRVLLSLGTVASEADSSSLRVGVGLRVNFSDANDPLSDPALFQRVSDLLLEAVDVDLPPVQPGGGRGVGAPIALSTKDSIAAAYEHAREAARNRPGWAASAGWGLGAVVRGAILDADSLQDAASTLWFSTRYKFAAPTAFLMTVRWHQIRGDRDDLSAGVAFRAEFEGVNAAAELAYDSFTGALQPGGNAEIRVLPGTRVVLSIVSEPPNSPADKRSRLRLKTDLKWNFAELLRKRTAF